MKHGFKLMFQKDLDDKEKEVALKCFHWFIKSSFNPQVWNEELKRLVPIEGVKLPSWKHITRDGHLNGAPLQRRKWGMRLEHLDKEVGKGLLFRRFSTSERIFVVQRTDSMDVMRVLPTDPETGNGCSCNKCMGGRPGRSRIPLDDFEQYAIIGDSKG